MQVPKITVRTSISVIRERVWQYYTSPAHIVNWNFATPEWHCPSAENNMVVGGKYQARMEAKDGSYGFDFVAKYKVINPVESFTYQMEDGRDVDVLFEETDGGTDVIVIFDAESQNSLEMQRDGWQAILDNFRRYAERQ